MRERSTSSAWGPSTTTNNTSNTNNYTTNYNYNNNSSHNPNPNSTPSVMFTSSEIINFNINNSNNNNGRGTTHCLEAWRCLAVGAFDEARRLSHSNDDILCWAAALAMCGETGKSLRMIEAYIISTCVVAHERRIGIIMSEERFVRRASEIVVSWIAGPKVAGKVIGKSIIALDEEYSAAVLDACDIIDWDTVHRWFIIALFLHDEEYKAPNMPWFRYFFALFTNGIPPTQLRSARGGGLLHKRREVVMQNLTGRDVEDILLSQCGKSEAFFISTVTAWKTRHYRSAITCATEFLQLEDLGLVITDANMKVMTIFIRCMCLIQIGERAIAANDALEILKNQDEFISTVGASIVSFLLPLPQAVDIVTSYEGPFPKRRYVHALCEYIHSLTLVQLGSMESAIKIIESTLPTSPDHDVGEWLLDLLIIACTALEDSSTILKHSLSPHQQLYIAMCPAFFGGFGKDCAKIRTHTPAGKLMYPKQLPTYASVRQTLPFHMNRAHHQFSQRKYIEAWDNICLAVACAEEIIGSVEFAFTDCSPICAYFFGCHVGAEVLNTLLEVSTLHEDSMDVRNVNISSKMLSEESDVLGEEVLRNCFLWAQRIRQFHPNVRMGSIALAEYYTFSRAENFISRAIFLSQKYPRCVTAQNCLTLALYANHHIPEAVDNAANVLQTFPHSREVVEVHRKIILKDGVYFFNYRTLVPIRYAPGSQRVWTKRMIIVIILLFINFLLFLGTLLVNVPNWLSYPESIKEIAVRLQLPSEIPLFYGILVIVYAVLATVSPQNLVRTLMQDLFFSDTRMNRFLFAMRGIALLNTSNAMQITIAGNNFLFQSHWYTFLLYLILAIVFVPFTTRVWFLPSIDEPKGGIWTWLTLLAIDTVTAFILIIPHILLFAIEPFMFIAFFFFQPVRRPDEDSVSGHVGKRLLMHQACLKKMPSRYIVGSGSQFIHVRLMSLLYYQTHSDLTTRFLVKSQIEEDNYRVFPLIEIDECISTEPIDREPHSNKPIHQRRRSNAVSIVSQNNNEDDDNDNDNDENNNNNKNKNNSNTDSDDDNNKDGRVPLLSKKEKRKEVTDSSSEDENNNKDGDFPREKGRLDLKSALTHDLNLTQKEKGESNDANTILSGIVESIKNDNERVREGDDSDNNNDDDDAYSAPLPLSRKGSGLIVWQPSSDDEDNVNKKNNKNKNKTNKNNSDSSSTSDSSDNSSNNNSRSSSIETPLIPISTNRRRSTSAGQQRPEARMCLSQFVDTVREVIHSKYINPLLLSANTANSISLSYPIPGNSPSSTSKKARKNSKVEQQQQQQQQEEKEETSEERRRHANPDFTSHSEKTFFYALQNLYSALITRGGSGSVAKQAAVMRAKRESVANHLTDLYIESKSKFVKLESQICRDLCNKIVIKMIEDGDSEIDIMTAGNVSLVEKFLLRLDPYPIIEALLRGGLLEHCVINGFCEMLAVIFNPICVQNMKLIHWESLLLSFQLDYAHSRLNSLQILLNAVPYIDSQDVICGISPLFQNAVEASLISEATKMSREALEELLRLIKNTERLDIDFEEIEGSGGQTIFSKACAIGNLQLVELLFLLELVTDPNRVQSDGTNALMQAVIYERRNIVLWFCERATGPTNASFIYQHPNKGTVLDISSHGPLYSLIKETINKIEKEVGLM